MTTQPPKVLEYIIQEPQQVGPAYMAHPDLEQALKRVSRVYTETDLFQALMDVFRLTSYCRIAASDLFMRMDEKAQKFVTTQRLYRQWTRRCYNPDLSVSRRCRSGCCRI